MDAHQILIGAQHIFMDTHHILIGAHHILIGAHHILVVAQHILMGVYFVLIGAQHIIIGAHYILISAHHILMEHFNFWLCLYIQMIYHYYRSISFKVSKGAKIRNRYNQVPHLTQDTHGKVTNSQLDTANKSQPLSHHFIYDLSSAYVLR